MGVEGACYCIGWGLILDWMGVEGGLVFVLWEGSDIRMRKNLVKALSPSKYPKKVCFLLVVIFPSR